MKRLLSLLLSSALLTACTTLAAVPPADTSEALPRNAAEALRRAQPLQEAAQKQKVVKTLYFDADWQPVETLPADGYYRQSYGLQDNGLYLVQDFYANGKKQTDWFYGTDETKTDSTDTRGYIALYDQEGRLKMSADYINTNRYHRLDWCDGILCADSHFTDRLNQGRYLAADGSRLAEWTQATNEQGDLVATMQYWYPNHQLASYSISRPAADAQSDTTNNMYYSEDGTLLPGEPATPAYQNLKTAVQRIDRQAFGADDEAPAEPTVADKAAHTAAKVAEHAAAAAVATADAYAVPIKTKHAAKKRRH